MEAVDGMWSPCLFQMSAAMTLFADDETSRGRLCAIRSHHVVTAVQQKAVCSAGKGTGGIADKVTDPALAMKASIQEATTTTIAKLQSNADARAVAVHAALADPDIPSSLSVPRAASEHTATTPGDGVDRLLAVIALLKSENDKLVEVCVRVRYSLCLSSVLFFGPPFPLPRTV